MKPLQTWFILLPALMQMQIPLLQLINFRNSQNVDLWDYCLNSLFLATVSFFLIELMWFIFGRKGLRLNSSHPFWREVLSQILTNLKASLIVLASLTFFSSVFALMIWGADVLTEEFVTTFDSYLTLSLSLHFYLAALFSIWHLFLAPRLSSLSQTKGLHSSQ